MSLDPERFLSRLQKVRRVGPGRWLACCPAHEDRSPSLNVKAAPDKILFICRSGCTQDEIIDSVGMEWKDFFPETSRGVYDRELNRAFPASDVLQALADESLIVATAACNIGQGVELTPEDKARLLLAYERISAARTMTLGQH